MKIVETIRKGEYDEDYSLSVKITTEKGKESLEFGSGEPEDMTLGRDLNDAYSIVTALELAYNAGKNGEPYEYVEKTIDEDEDE